MDNLGTNAANGSMIYTTVANIFIPFGVDRNEYVQTCMRRGVCSVFRKNSFGIIKDVRIGKEEAQIIRWPSEVGKFGSLVVLVLEPFNKIYSVVAVLSEEGSVEKTQEGVRIIEQETKNGRSTIILNGNEGTTTVLSEGGDVSVISRGGRVNIKSLDEVFIEAPKINQNKADEPILRGQKTVDLIEELIDLLFKARTATSIGLQPLNTFVEINALKQKLEELKSTKSYIE